MKKTLQDSLQDVFQKARADLAATVGSIEEEVGRRVRRARERVDPTQAADDLQRSVADLGRRLHESGEQLERRVEASMRAAVSRVRDPLAEELATLRRRAEELSARIESHLGRRPEGQEPTGDDRDDRGPHDAT